MIRQIQLAFFIALLAGCSTMQPQPEVIAPISSKPAVTDLLDKAALDTSYGDYEQAKSKLERALRFEPQNAYVWFELAKVNKAQGKYAKAKNLALRAQSFSTEPRLQKTITHFLNTL